MSRASVVLVSLTALVGGMLNAVTASAAPPSGPSGSGDRLEVYTATVDAAGLEALGEAGVDRGHAVRAPAKGARAKVELVLTPGQAKALGRKGVDVEVKRVDGVPASRALAKQAAAGFRVFRPYSGAGGIAAELRATARRHPGLTELVRIGTSGRGKPILAVRITRKARQQEDGSRPAVLYAGTQHAREWITPEMVRRLMHRVLNGYGTNRRITRLVRTRELWFLPVQNPDGYDYTFTTGNRLWRKTLRDNNRDGRIAPGDGVDMNRNFPYKWGYDNEGSSPEPINETYRGPRAASEPETRAVTRLVRRVGFDFFMNYHSAAELLLYGVGWQVETPTPDDQIYKALAGTDAHPAVPGYDPDLSAELYTTNGDTDGDMHQRLRTLTYTPEMSTCETASAVDPDDQWDPADCASVFNFPDDRGLVRAEFEKNVPFALSLADSAADPDDPRSVVGLRAKNLVPHRFTRSNGRSQTVAVTAKRALRSVRMHFRINGGPTRTRAVRAWRGGEKYGTENDVYYGEFRATVPRQRAGDRVGVWFTGRKPGVGRVATRPFRYRVAAAKDIGADVLVLAAEDYTGLSPEQAGGPNAASAYTKAIHAAGYTTDVYDVDAEGRQAPDPLGVLSHYDAVVWETGDDIIPRNQGQVAATAAKWAYDTELNVRDYVNEGGKLLVAGKYALYAQAANGGYFYNPREAVGGSCTTPGAYPCLPLGNDFLQYWLGAYTYIDDGGTGETGPLPLVGKAGGPFAGFQAQPAATQDHTAAFVATSAVLPVDRFPQFESRAPLSWSSGKDPFSPYTGDWFVASNATNAAYKRLSRTVDLTAATSGRLDFRLSADTETDYDFVFVEARPVGTDDWTTLPDANGHTSQDIGSSCGDGWSALHPQLLHYQGTDCSPTGTTGEWNAFTGSSGGWQDWSVDLSAYAGQQVELSISYATDPAVLGLGAWVDDASVVADGSTVASTSFETGLDGWTVPGPPAGTALDADDWTRTSTGLDVGGATTTKDTALFGFGLEGLPWADRKDLVARSMRTLLGDG